MTIILNLIFTAVVICYLFLKQSYMELVIVLIFTTILSIYNRKKINLFFRNIKINKLLYIDFIPIVLFISIISFTLGNDYIYTSQDSLVFWGHYIKWIYLNNELWDNVTELMYKNNIPGVPIYEYIIVSIFGYSEKNIALSLHFLTFLSLSVVVKKLLKNKSDHLILAPIVFIILPLLGYSFVDIMVDGLLASVITLYTVMFYLFLKEKEKFYSLIPISIFLVMIKPVCIWYLLFIPSFLIIWFWFVNKYNDKKLVNFQFFHILLILAPALYIWYDWNNYIELIDAKREPHMLYSQFLSSEFNIKFMKVLTGFNSWAKNGNFLLLKFVELPNYVTHLLLNLITVIILHKQINIKRLIIILAILNIFVVCNLFTYLLLITFHFGDYESENVASIGRYFGLIYVVWLVVIAVLFYNILLKPIFISRTKTKLIFILISYLASISVLLFTQDHYSKMGPSKEAFKDFKALNSHLTLTKKSNSTKVYFISQGNFGHEVDLFYYMLSPFSKKQMCWSFTNRLIPGKTMHWDCKGSIISRLDGYTHVYIHKLDKNFINEQKIYFKNNKIIQKSLYEINFDNNKENTFLSLE